MKKSMNMLLATTMLATQMFAINALAEDPSRTAKIKQMIEDKIKSSTLKVGTGLHLGMDLGDALHIQTGLKYQYVLDPDLSKFLREDRWNDSVEASLGFGVIAANRKIERQMSYGRFYDDWNVAVKQFLFSPLDLKNLTAETLSARMESGDLASITLSKGTFLGLRASNSGTNALTVEGRAGKVFCGKITTKFLKKADNKITVSFANADENAIQLAGNVKIEVIPGLLTLKLLSIDADFRLRGTAELATYTYDLSNPRAVEEMNKVLESFDEPTILGDEALLKEGIKLSPKLSKGIIDVTGSENASQDVTSGIVKEQKLVNNIVDGRRGNVQFKLIPGLLQSGHEKAQSINLIDMNFSGSFIRPGQYIVGYRTNKVDERSFGDKTVTSNITSVVYQPDPVLQNPDNAKGYRGIHDLVGISYHTEASAGSNPKEMITYSKLCNAGLIDCAGPIQLTVIDPLIERRSKGKADMNSNYFFSRGMFEKIKERMNWAASSKNQQSDAIKAAIAPIINEIVLPVSEDSQGSSSIAGRSGRNYGPAETTRRMTDFFQEIFANDCYSNLIGLDAQNERNFFKRIFSAKCGTNLYDISDEVVRLNMPALLISMYDPNILPAMNNPLAKASPEAKAELSKYFSVSFNSNYKTDGEDMMKTVNGASYGMSVKDNSTSAAQVMEFTSLINTWQQQQNLDINLADRLKMLGARQ